MLSGYSAMAFYLSQFSLAISKMARKEKEKTKAAPRPKYVMPEPNDDAAAYGWDLGKLRYPSKDSTKGDVWPGRNMFEIAGAEAFIPVYGFDIHFVCAKFVQLVFDSEPAIMEGAKKVRDAGYTKAALEEYNKTVQRVFAKVVVPQMITYFNNMSQSVAEFYAARLAHITKFGDDDYIEASTTKSRR